MTPYDFIHNWLPWVMSAATIWMTFLQGKKDWKAWLVGLCNQFLWLAFAIGTETWGLLPLNAVLWVLYFRNMRLWLRDDGFVAPAVEREP